jgi:hypothetical protein
MAAEDVLQAKDLPTFHGREYNPGAAYESKIVCDNAHDTRCHGSCLAWNDEWRQGYLYPYAMICFPSFELVYGSCSLDRTMYENCAIQHPRESYRTRIELEEQIDRELLYKPEKTTICKNRKRSLVEEIPQKKQFQCGKSIKNLGNAKQESLSVNKIPESGGKIYKPGAVEPIICNDDHGTRFDGKCLIWKDRFLDKKLFPMEKKICFPSSDEVYGNCNIERTNYENQCIINESSAKTVKGNIGLRIILNFKDKPVKQLPDGSNKKLSVLKQRSLTMFVEQLYDEPYLSCNEDNFISKVPLLCECYRSPLFSLTQAQFCKRVVATFEAHAQRSTLSWDSSKAIRDAQLPRVLLPYYP